MAGRGAWRAILILVTLAAFLRTAAATDIVRSSAAPQLVSPEISLLARVVQAESSGEPAVGQQAVAWTAVNRLKAGIYGKTLTRVLQARRQYARPKPLKPNSPAYQAALRAALMAVKGVGGDPTRGSTHFVRCDMRRKPAWARKLTMTTRISQHCFFKSRAPHHD
jgi:spore germination cell wall hydrolase CwlJ-like protein